MPRADRAGFPTYWTTFGQGPRDAVAIHCSLASSGAWGGLARDLSGALTITAFDMPGHGRSADWDARGEIQKVTTDIACDFIRDAAGPVDLIGHSFGATVALRAALRDADAVRSLVLIEPVFFAVAERSDRQVFAAHSALERPYRDALAAGSWREASRAFVGLWGAGKRWEEIPEEQRQTLAAQMPLIAAADPALYEDAGGMLAPGRLEGLNRPVLLLAGSDSPPVTRAINEGLAARLPDARSAVIGGAGHMVPITHPAQVSAEILRFYS